MPTPRRKTFKTPSCSWTDELKNLLDKRLHFALDGYNNCELTPALLDLVIKVKKQTVESFCQIHNLDKPFVPLCVGDFCWGIEPKVYNRH